jgi:hypothetical protein
MAEVTSSKGKPRASLTPAGSKLVLLISSTSGSLEVRSRQARVQAILEGLFLPLEDVVLFDGSNPELKQRRLELFVLSGSKAQYPQLFVERPDAASGITTSYVGNAEDILALHDSNTLGDAIGLVVHESGEEDGAIVAPVPDNTPAEESAPPPQEEEEEEDHAPPTMDLDSATLAIDKHRVTTPKEALVVEEKELPEPGTNDQCAKAEAATSWVRQPSTRHFIVDKAAEKLQKEKSVSLLRKYKGSPQHEWAALKIQRTTRHVLPVLSLQNKFQTVKDGAAKDVQKIQKDTQKCIAKMQKQFDKDCKTVDKLAKDIRHQQKKEKSLKKEVKVEKKQRDDLKKITKPRDKELKRQEKHTKRLKSYKKKVEREQKNLAQWDKDIKAVQAENERLLNAITTISEKLAMSGMNWTELMKEEAKTGKGGESNKEPGVAADNEEIPGVAGTEMKKVGEDTTIKLPATAKSKPAPARVPPRGRLQSILRRQEARRSVVAMVREESQRFGKPGENDKKHNSEEIQPSPVYFVRLNSRARLVT